MCVEQGITDVDIAFSEIFSGSDNPLRTQFMHGFINGGNAVCMGTAFKKDGVFNGRVDEERVRSFMEIVYDIRARL